MVFLLSIPAILSLLALAAHYLRENNPLFFFLTLGVCCILFVRHPWVARTTQIALVFAAFVWIYTTWSIVQERIADQRRWHLAAGILLGVATLSLLSAALYQTRRLKAYYSPAAQPPRGFPVITPTSPAKQS